MLKNCDKICTCTSILVLVQCTHLTGSCTWHIKSQCACIILSQFTHKSKSLARVVFLAIASMFSRGNYPKIPCCGRRSHFKIIFNLVKILSKWIILSLTILFLSFGIRNKHWLLFIRAQFEIIGLGWCQNHNYTLSFARDIVMVLTLPWAYYFNCAPHSSQYLYTICAETIRRYNNSPSTHDWQNSGHYYSINTSVKKGPNSPFYVPWKYQLFDQITRYQRDASACGPVKECRTADH